MRDRGHPAICFDDMGRTGMGPDDLNPAPVRDSWQDCRMLERADVRHHGQPPAVLHMVFGSWAITKDR